MKELKTLKFPNQDEAYEIVDAYAREQVIQAYQPDNPPPYPVTSVNGATGAVVLPSETWTFTLADGSTVTKKVVIAQ